MSYKTNAKNKCPKCGAKLDMAFGVRTDLKPSSGDFSLCIKCGELLVFGNDLELRLPTEQEKSKGGMNSDVLAAQIVIRGIK